jgi:hypothetical protein
LTVEDSRIVCCLETWIKEIAFDDDEKDFNFDKLNFDKLNRATYWLVNTYLNEIKDGDYVSDEEYQEWLKNRKI